MNKFAFPGSSKYNKGSGKRLETTIFYYGVVVSNIDELSANRVKVRIVGVDDHISDVDLDYAFPMLQKFVHIVPKVGETVLIFIPDARNTNIDRLYVGPIISQPQLLNKDSELFSPKSALSSGIKDGLPSPNTIPENRGVYPKIDEIAIQGRNNNDIILKDKEVLLRAGKFDSSTTKGDIPKFNRVNPSYIQIKHDVTLKQGTESTNPEIGGVINIVSNKINLLTHKNGSPRFALNDQNSMISDKELLKIMEEAHPLVFGDKLIELIRILTNAFLNHVHAYPGMRPQDLSGGNDIDKLLDFDVKSILSKNIHIN